MTNEEIKEDTFLDNLPKPAQLPPKPVGRPLKAGSGTFIQPVSAPYSWRKIMEKYEISPSVAFQQGILMLLHQKENFPETSYEEMMPKGIHIEKIEQLTNILSKVKA